MKGFSQLFAEEIKDIYSAEKQIDKLLPELIEKVSNHELKEALKAHHKETKEHIERLEKIGQEIGVNFGGAECEGMKGLVREVQNMLKMNFLDQVLDAAIVSMLQRIEHYEIAAYGVLKAFARHLKLKEIEELLGKTSKEEGHADKKLTELAEGKLFGSGINVEASKRKSA